MIKPSFLASLWSNRAITSGQPSCSRPRLAFAADDVALHAYCRTHLIDQLHPETLRFFEQYGVQLAPISRQFEVPYPQGNKLYACAASRAVPTTILFDTDMFMLQPAFLADTLRSGAVSGRPTGDWMWGMAVDAGARLTRQLIWGCPVAGLHAPAGLMLRKVCQQALWRIMGISLVRFGAIRHLRLKDVDWRKGFIRHLIKSVCPLQRIVRASK